MKKEVKVAIVKFIVMTLLITYILFVIRKYLLVAFIDNQFVGLNKDLLANRAIIEAQVQRATNIFFLTYFILGLRGSWGASFQTGEDIGLTLFPALQMSLLAILVASVICYTIGGFIILYLNRTKHTDKLRIFQSNIALYLVCFVILAIIILSPNSNSFFYNRQVNQNVLTSSSFLFFSLLVLPLVSLAKFLHLLSSIPRSSSATSTINLSYPDPQAASDTIELTSIPMLPSMAYILKSLIVFQIDVLIIFEQFFNLPGVALILIQALLFFDISMVIPCIFYLTMVILIIRMFADIYMAGHQFPDSNDLQIQLRPITKDQPYKITKWIVNLFYGLVITTGLIWLFTGFHFSAFMFLYDPNQIDLQNRDLSILTNGHLLGTDFLGRDIFSYLIFSCSSFFLPLFVGGIVLVPLVLVIKKIPTIGEIAIGYHIFDSFQSLPKLLYIILFTFITILPNADFPKTIILFIAIPLVLLGELGKFCFRSTDERQTTLEKYRILFHFTALMTFTQLSLLNFLGFSPIQNDLQWASIFNSILNNFPSNNIIKIIIVGMFPVIFLTSWYFYTANVRKTINSIGLLRTENIKNIEEK